MESLLYIIFILFLQCNSQYTLTKVVSTIDCTPSKCITSDTTMTVEGPAVKTSKDLIILMRDTILLFDFNMTISSPEVFAACEGDKIGEFTNGFVKAFPNCVCDIGDNDYIRLCPFPDEAEPLSIGCNLFFACNGLDKTCPCSIKPINNPSVGKCGITGCVTGHNSEWCGILRNEFPKTTTVKAVNCTSFETPFSNICNFVSPGILHEMICIYEISKTGQSPVLNNKRMLMLDLITSSCRTSGVIVIDILNLDTKIFTSKNIYRLSLAKQFQTSTESGISINVDEVLPIILWNDGDDFVGQLVDTGITYKLEKDEFCQFSTSQSCFYPIVFLTNSPTIPRNVASLINRIGPFGEVVEIAIGNIPICTAALPQINKGQTDGLLRLNPTNTMSINEFEFRTDEQCSVNCGSVSCTDGICLRCKEECKLGNFYKISGQNIAFDVIIHNAVVKGIFEGHCVITSLKCLTIFNSTGSLGGGEMEQTNRGGTADVRWFSPSGFVIEQRLPCNDIKFSMQLLNWKPINNSNTVEICGQMSIGEEKCQICAVNVVAPSAPGVPPPSKLPSGPGQDAPPPSDGGLTFIQILLIIGAVILGIILLGIIFTII